MADALDLVDLPRALAAFPGGLDAGRAATIPALITAASVAISRWCNRPFVLTACDDLITPRPGQWDRGEPDLVQLRAFPVQALTRVAAGRTTALLITNTSPAVQRATVTPTTTGDPEWQLILTGLTLARTASGVTTTSTLTFAASPTLNALAAAVIALGNGWGATVAPPYGLHASADLVAPLGPQGALAATGQAAGLDLYPADLTVYRVDRATGQLWLHATVPATGAWSQWSGTAGLDPLASSRPEVRVRYDAGWATVPAPVQQACAMAVQQMFYDQETANVYKAETIGAYSYTLADIEESIPAAARQLLAAYRIFRL